MGVMATRKQLLVAGATLTILLSGLLLVTERAAAQQRPGRPLQYQSPSGTPITPYLNYFRRDRRSPVSPYDTFVRPRQQLGQTLYEQRYGLNRVGTRLRTFEGEVADEFQQEQRQRERPSLARPTGTGSTFFNFSHYYRR